MLVVLDNINRLGTVVYSKLKCVSFIQLQVSYTVTRTFTKGLYSDGIITLNVKVIIPRKLVYEAETYLSMLHTKHKVKARPHYCTTVVTLHCLRVNQFKSKQKKSWPEMVHWQADIP